MVFQEEKQRKTKEKQRKEHRNLIFPQKTASKTAARDLELGGRARPPASGQKKTFVSFPRDFTISLRGIF